MPKNQPIKPKLNNTAQVDEYMAQLDHPLKAEVQALRALIKSVSPNITEEVKWVAPSFSYKGYLATFNLRARQHVHLIFHNGAILGDKSGLLQGDYKDRRMAYFTDMADVQAKQAALVKAIKTWIKLMDQGVSPT